MITAQTKMKQYCIVDSNKNSLLDDKIEMIFRLKRGVWYEYNKLREPSDDYIAMQQCCSPDSILTILDIEINTIRDALDHLKDGVDLISNIDSIVDDLGNILNDLTRTVLTRSWSSNLEHVIHISTDAVMFIMILFKIQEHIINQIAHNTSDSLGYVTKLMHINEQLATCRDVLSRSIMYNDEINPFIVEIYYFIEIIDHTNGKFDR